MEKKWKRVFSKADFSFIKMFFRFFHIFVQHFFNLFWETRGVGAVLSDNLWEAMEKFGKSIMQLGQTFRVLPQIYWIWLSQSKINPGRVLHFKIHPVFKNSNELFPITSLILTLDKKISIDFIENSSTKNSSSIEFRSLTSIHTPKNPTHPSPQIKELNQMEKNFCESLMYK